MSLKRCFSVKSVFVVSYFLLSLCGCASLPDPDPEWQFSQNAIQIYYQADDELNLYKEGAHTISVVIYQLSETNAFDDLASYEEGIKKLLVNENFDPSVKNRRRIVVQPGELNKVVLDRAEGAQWVGLIAGYYDLHPGKVSCTLKIPYVFVDKGIIKEKKVAVVTTLNAHIVFGRHGIEEVELK